MVLLARPAGLKAPRSWNFTTEDAERAEDLKSCVSSFPVRAGSGYIPVNERDDGRGCQRAGSSAWAGSGNRVCRLVANRKARCWRAFRTLFLTVFRVASGECGGKKNRRVGGYGGKGGCIGSLRDPEHPALPPHAARAFSRRTISRRADCVLPGRSVWMVNCIKQGHTPLPMHAG